MFVSRKKAKISHSFEYIECRSYNSFDPIAFQREIDEYNWDDIMMCNDVNTAVELFNREFIKLVNKHAPFRRLKMLDNAPGWLNGDMLAHINEREYWTRKFKKFRTDWHLEKKLSAKRRTRVLKLALQSDYFDEKLRDCGNDSKRKWRLIKEYWPVLRKSSSIEKIRDKTDNIGKATVINEFFATIGSTLDQTIPQRCTNPVNVLHQPPVFDIQELQLIDIATVIRDMSPSTSCGTDGITARIIKAAGPSLFPIILHFVNSSIHQSVFPLAWK